MCLQTTKENSMQSLLRTNEINFLGFERAANGTMRLCSTELAKELLDIVDRASNPEQMTLPNV